MRDDPALLLNGLSSVQPEREESVSSEYALPQSSRPSSSNQSRKVDIAADFDSDKLV
jgi:hypothetical protein